MKGCNRAWLVGFVGVMTANGLFAMEGEKSAEPNPLTQSVYVAYNKGVTESFSEAQKLVTDKKPIVQIFVATQHQSNWESLINHSFDQNAITHHDVMYAIEQFSNQSIGKEKACALFNLVIINQLKGKRVQKVTELLFTGSVAHFYPNAKIWTTGMLKSGGYDHAHAVTVLGRTIEKGHLAAFAEIVDALTVESLLKLVQTDTYCSFQKFKGAHEESKEYEFEETTNSMLTWVTREDYQYITTSKNAFYIEAFKTVVNKLLDGHTKNTAVKNIDLPLMNALSKLYQEKILTPEQWLHISQKFN